MGKPSTVSPFAALNSQQQKEQWICWQSQKQSENIDIEAKPTKADSRSESVLNESKPTIGRIAKTYHSQYNAVLKRMKQAQRQASCYIDC